MNALMKVIINNRIYFVLYYLRMGGMNTSDFLWCMRRQVILELAEKESCMIVGRCADYILKDDPNAFHVFVHANDDFRAERIVRLYGKSEKEPIERLRDKDKKKSLNYKHFTGRPWGVCQNYNLSLDSSVIGVDRCVSLIVIWFTRRKRRAEIKICDSMKQRVTNDELENDGKWSFVNN